MPPKKTQKGKAQSKKNAKEVAKKEKEAQEEEEKVQQQEQKQEQEQVENEQGKQESTKSSSLEDRLKALRKKKYESVQANRKELVDDANKRQMTARENARLERKRKMAEAMGEKLEAEETGEDLERKRNWQYTVEDDERWTAKLEKKKARAQFEFNNFDDAARKKYYRDIEELKPNLSTYRSNRDSAAEQEQQLTPSGSSSSALVQQNNGDDDTFYRSANTFIYADHKPEEEDIDRMVSKLNADYDKRTKRSRRRDDSQDNVTYINDKNKHFNKKLGRFYDKYTQEIRDNFERGTAL